MLLFSFSQYQYSMELFTELGAIIEQRWRERNYDETIFPQLAADHLGEADLPSQISAWDVAAWALRETNLPEQRDLSANFGEPPLTVFNSSRFHIDVYYWLQSTTAVHQHGFCGAFQVLMGGSLQSLYSFEERERINFHCAVGDIKLERVDWLKVGDVKQIHGGDKFIHSLFHLENPSATIVARTHRSPLALPQFSYYKPSLALDPFFDEPNLIRKRQLVSTLINARKPEAELLIIELLQSADFHTAVEYLRFLRPAASAGTSEAAKMQQAQQQHRFENYLEIVQQKHGELADSLKAVFDEQARQNEITARRSFVTDTNHRYFLALLLNVEGRENILRLVKEREPEQDAVETILDWIEELGRTRITGTTENALGIADFNDDYAFVLEGMLKGETPDAIETRIRTEFPDAHAAEIAGKISQYHETLKNSQLFRSLWVD